MSGGEAKLLAPIKWAQRGDSLYVTIALPDVKDETLNLTETGLSFK
jgi:cytosolic prostaglandin-E synthase